MVFIIFVDRKTQKCHYCVRVWCTRNTEFGFLFFQEETQHSLIEEMFSFEAKWRTPDLCLLSSLLVWENTQLGILPMTVIKAVLKIDTSVCVAVTGTSKLFLHNGSHFCSHFCSHFFVSTCSDFTIVPFCGFTTRWPQSWSCTTTLPSIRFNLDSLQIISGRF